MECVAIYDSCGQNSSIHEEFGEQLRLSTKRLPHTLITSVGREENPDGKLFNCLIRGKEEDAWVKVQAIAAPKLGEDYERIRIPIAPEFIEEHEALG